MKIETKFDKYNKVFFAYEVPEGYVAYTPGEIQGINLPTKFNDNFMDVKINYVIWYNPIEHNTKTEYSVMEVPEDKVFATEKEAAAACVKMNGEILEKMKLQKQIVLDKLNEQKKAAARQ